jgi:hypothetical protein
MAVGQTLADILGGLVAINRGDASGAQAFTKQGRADLAQQRQNSRSQQGMMAEVLQKAQQDPQYNAMLQAALQPFLQNEATRAGTAQSKAQTEQVIPAQVENYRANTLQTKEQTGLMKPEFNTRLMLANAQAGNLGASTQATQQQTAKSKYDQAQQFALDLMANQIGLPNWQAATDLMNQTFREKQLSQQGDLGQKQIAAGMFGQMLPNYQTGGVSADQRNVAQQAGVNLPEPQPDPRQAAMAQELQAAMQRMGQKKQRPQSKQGQRQSNKVEQKPKVLEPLNKMNYMRFPEWPYDIWGNPKQPQPEVEMLPLETIQQMLQHLANSQG